MTGVAARAAAAVTAVAALTALTAPAAVVADGTVALEAGRPLATALTAMGTDGAAAALYPRGDEVRLVMARPGDGGRTAGGAPEAVPLPQGAAVEGLAVASGGRVLVAFRTAHSCAPVHVLTRAADGTWASAEAGGGAAVSAAVATAPDGSAAVLAVGCAGDVALRTQDAAGGWSVQPIGFTAAPTARASLALGAAGLAVAGVDGPIPLLLVRQAGAWARTSLPGGPPAVGETIATLRVGIDAQSHPVALLRRVGETGIDVTGPIAAPVSWSLDRLLGTASWVPVSPGGPDSVDVASGGGTLVARRRDGTMLVEGPGGTLVAQIDTLAAAGGPGGAFAYVPRGGPPVLGVGTPPSVTVTAPRSVRFGEAAALRISVTDAAGRPLPRVRVRAAALAAATDDAGAVTLRPVLTATGPVEVVLADAGPVPPMRVTVRIAVRPQPVVLRATIARGASRAVVTGTAASPAA
ncbi:MAG: hypothetical protein AB1416_11485, partial [Actinomycetota bacterium]